MTYAIVLDAAEKAAADGNIIYYEYQECDGTPQTLSLAGDDTVCSLILGTKDLYYFVGGNPVDAVNSTITGTGIPCS
jgi:hypothetical protein